MGEGAGCIMKKEEVRKEVPSVILSFLVTSACQRGARKTINAWGRGKVLRSQGRRVLGQPK